MKISLKAEFVAARRPMSGRKKALFAVAVAVALLAAIAAGSLFVGAEAMQTQLERRNLAPSLQYPFGTDWLGRDMLARTVDGLALSIRVGLAGAAGGTAIAVVMGVMAGALGRMADRVITWLIDLFMSVPHLVALLLIAFVSGGGAKGIMLGIALTHWTSLARVIRAETLQLKSAEYVLVSRRLGKSGWWTATRHLLPHLLPQMSVGLLLLFPHAILHEAAITFLGMGLSPHQPAIGVILSESMRYLSVGMWWLAVFPGLGLLAVVLAFDRIGDSLRALADPWRARE